MVPHSNRPTLRDNNFPKTQNRHFVLYQNIFRDLQGKDPFIDLPFNQYHRDPEYRAFWQKKNGVFYMLNSIAFLILAFTPVTSLLYRIIFGIAIVGDLLYLVAYESWNHSAD